MHSARLTGTSSAMSEFWAGLSGVIVGAVLSLIVSLVVARRAVVREMRVRVYEDLLPPLRSVLQARESTAFLPQYAESSRKLLEPIVRAAHVAGGVDARKADDLNVRLGRWEELLDKTRTEFDDEHGLTVLAFSEDLTESGYAAAVDAFKEAAEDYREWLKERLSGWL